MYSRNVAGKLLEFGHEGVLYRNSFVMYDRKTDSLWVHTTGECVKGEHKGKQLEFLPSTVTSWEEWRKKHPKSLVLKGEGRGGFMGTYTLKPDNADKFGISVGQGEEAKLYLVPELMKQGVVHDAFNGRNIVVFFDKAGMHATAWNCGAMRFKMKGSVVVDAKGREFDLMLGKPKGTLDNGEKMIPLPATAWLINRWRGFYPKGRIWTAP